MSWEFLSWVNSFPNRYFPEEVTHAFVVNSKLVLSQKSMIGWSGNYSIRSPTCRVTAPDVSTGRRLLREDLCLPGDPRRRGSEVFGRGRRIGLHTIADVSHGASGSAQSEKGEKSLLRILLLRRSEDGEWKRKPLAPALLGRQIELGFAYIPYIDRCGYGLFKWNFCSSTDGKRDSCTFIWSVQLCTNMEFPSNLRTGKCTSASCEAIMASMKKAQIDCVACFDSDYVSMNLLRLMKIFCSFYPSRRSIVQIVHSDQNTAV